MTGFANLLTDHKSQIELLDFQSNQISDVGIPELCKGIHHRIGRPLILMLGGNYIADHGTQKLCECFEKGCIIQLYLDRNKITDGSAGRISLALERTSVLIYLNVKGNLITESGQAKIMGSVKVGLTTVEV